MVDAASRGGEGSGRTSGWNPHGLWCPGVSLPEALHGNGDVSEAQAMAPRDHPIWQERHRLLAGLLRVSEYVRTVYAGGRRLRDG